MDLTQACASCNAIRRSICAISEVVSAMIDLIACGDHPLPESDGDVWLV